jgi:hypothetical protein
MNYYHRPIASHLIVLNFPACWFLEAECLDPVDTVVAVNITATTIIFLDSARVSKPEKLYHTPDRNIRTVQSVLMYSMGVSFACYSKFRLFTNLDSWKCVTSLHNRLRTSGLSIRVRNSRQNFRASDEITFLCFRDYWTLWGCKFISSC